MRTLNGNDVASGRWRAFGWTVVIACGAALTGVAVGAGVTEGDWPRTDLSAKERVAVAIRTLEHEGVREQGVAVGALARHRETAVPALVAVARERGRANPHLRLNVILALRAIGDPRGTPFAAEVLADPEASYPQRRGAAQAIGASGGEGATEALLGALEDRYIPLMVDAIDGLARLGATEAVPAILDRAKEVREIRVHALVVVSTRLPDGAEPDDLAPLMPEDPPPTLRAAYLEARAHLGDKAAWEQIEEMLAAAKSEAVRLELAVRLLDAEREAGRRALEALLDAEQPNVAAEAMRIAAGTPGLAPERVAAALGPREPEDQVFGRLKQVGARMHEAVIRRAVTARFLDPKEQMPVRVAAANRLAESGRPEVWKPLVARLEEGGGTGAVDSLTHAIGCALARAEGATSELVRLARSDDPATSRGAVAGLVRRGGPGARRVALERLERDDPAARIEAAQVLAQIGTADELTAMKAAWTREEDAGVRRALADAARRIARSGR